MVLPAPAAHDQQGPPVAPWVERVARAFRGRTQGVIVLVDNAVNARLGELVRGLLAEHADLDVVTEAHRLEDLARGAFVVLAARPDDARWLNYARPIFSERALNVVLWSSKRKKATASLARGAPDFFDWISRRFECPKGPPRSAILGLRAALCARAPGVHWRGPGLDQAFAAAFPGRPLIRAHTDRSYDELLDLVRGARRGFIAWSGVSSERLLYRARWAMAEAGRRGRVLLDNPKLAPSDFWLVHGQLMSLPEATRRLEAAGAETPGRLAALLDLEPEAVHLAVALLDHGTNGAVLRAALQASGDPGATLARLARGSSSAKTIACFEATPPARRALFREIRARAGGERSAAVALIRESLRAQGMAAAEEVEPLLRAGPVPAEWDALAAAARSVRAIDVARRWSTRGLGSREAGSSRSAEGARALGERTAAAWSALERGDLEAAERALPSLDEATELLGRSWSVEEAIHHHEDLAQRNEEACRYGDAVLEVAQAALAAGRARNAVSLFSRLVHEHWTHRSPEVCSAFLRGSIEALVQLAETDASAAEHGLRELLQQGSRRWRTAPEELSPARRALADILAAQGRFPEAEEELLEALALEEMHHGVEAPAVGRTLTRLADVLAAQARHAEVEPLAARALAIARSAPGETSPEVALALRRLAGSRAVLGRPDARETAQRALDALQAAFDAAHPVRRETEPHLRRILGTDA